MKVLNATKKSDIVAGALFDFCGRLSTMARTLKVGSSEDPSELLAILRKWAEQRGLDINHADVQDWEKKI